MAAKAGAAETGAAETGAAGTGAAGAAGAVLDGAAAIAVGAGCAAKPLVMAAGAEDAAGKVCRAVAVEAPGAIADAVWRSACAMGWGISKASPRPKKAPTVAAATSPRVQR